MPLNRDIKAQELRKLLLHDDFIDDELWNSLEHGDFEKHKLQISRLTRAGHFALDFSKVAKYIEREEMQLPYPGEEELISRADVWKKTTPSGEAKILRLSFRAFSFLASVLKVSTTSVASKKIIDADHLRIL